MPLGTIKAGADLLGIKTPNVKNLFKGAFNSIFGGRSCSGTQKKNRAEVAKLIDQFMPFDERKRLASMAKSRVTPDGQSMARFYFGGGDCFHKNVHPDDQRYLNELPGALEKAIADAERKKLSKNPTALSASKFTLGTGNLTRTVGFAFGIGLLFFLAVRSYGN